MLHPVGDHSASVYWRRRILLLAALVLVALSCYALISSNSGGTDRATGPSPAGSTSHYTGQQSSSATSSPAASTTPPASTASSISPTAGAAVSCTASQLKITATSDAKTYPPDGAPVLSLVVIDIGSRPCVSNLADTQIELRVYAGSARVWGSHDCEVQPGTNKVTLPVGKAIQREIQWSGLSSQPGCAGVRQRVPAGTYTVYALLGGQQGTPATFTFSG